MFRFAATLVFASLALVPAAAGDAQPSPVDASVVSLSVSVAGGSH